MPPARKKKATPTPTRWPERDVSKASLDHFGKFWSTLRMPDGGRSAVLEDFQLAKLSDFFPEWDRCERCHGTGTLSRPEGLAVACDECAGIGQRIVREGFFESLWIEPTGMGKSTLMAGVALHHATYVRVDPRVYVLGGLGGHAMNTLEACNGFISRSEDLSNWWKNTKYGLGAIISQIPEDTDDAGIFASSAGRRVGARGGSAQEGKGPTLVLVEEDHRHEDNGAAVATMVSKVQKRSTIAQVQVVHATTVGEDEDSHLGRLVKRATDVENGARVTVTAQVAEATKDLAEGVIVDPDLRPGEYYRRAVDADGDLVMHEWAVPDEIGPPSSNATREKLDEYLQHVKRAAPASMVSIRSLRLSWRSLSAQPWAFIRQHANQWVRQDFTAIDRFGWRAGNVGPALKIPPGRHTSVIEPGSPAVYVGLDLAGRWDRTAIVPVWIHPESKRPQTAGAVILGSTAPGAQRRARNAIDVLLSMLEVWPNMAIAFDRNYGGGLIAEQLEEDHGLTVVDFNQSGAPMELASMLLGELVDQKGIDHDGKDELTRHVLAAVRRKSRYGKRWRLDQPRSGEPIDGAAALAMGVYSALNPPPPERTPIDVSQYRIEPL